MEEIKRLQNEDYKNIFVEITKMLYMEDLIDDKEEAKLINLIKNDTDKAS